MNFSYAFVGILMCLTIECNGQFKIIGLLDTKSDSTNGSFEKIRSFDSVPEQLLPKDDIIQEGRDFTETINIPESVDVIKDTNNVNFIKPYDVTTNDLKNIEVTSESTVNDASKVLVKNDLQPDEHLKGKVVADTDDLEYLSDVEVTSESKSLPSRPSTSNSKSYRKSFQPNIRKFSYVEARNVNHPDSSNVVTPSTRSTNYKFIKVQKYRNKYKSKCRCERIWNCPKIQISIQRCEPDYFMCCF